MFYYNLRYHFKLQDTSPTSAGSIILACAMPREQLVRRDFKKIEHLQHRLFDPQLYLASIDPSTAPSAVGKLATYPWFGDIRVPNYDSGAQKLSEWKASAKSELVDQWTREVPTDDAKIRLAVAHAIHLQMSLNVEKIILPAPLVSDPHRGWSEASRWIDIGIELCATARINKQLLATVAIPDHILRTDATVREPLLNSVTGYVATKKELAGAYLVVEQGNESGYVLTSFDTCCAILSIVDDIARGARKIVVVNYAGAFGAVAAAAGAAIWSANFYQNLRRMRLNDFDDKNGRTYPRYFSLQLLGDISLDTDMDILAKSGNFFKVKTPSPAAADINAALMNQDPVSSVFAWQYSQSNLKAATAHLHYTLYKIGAHSDGLDPDARVKWMHRLLKRAASLAEELSNHTPKLNPGKSDFRHQKTWLRSFEWWMNRAGYVIPGASNPNSES